MQNDNSYHGNTCPYHTDNMNAAAEENDGGELDDEGEQPAEEERNPVQHGRLFLGTKKRLFQIPLLSRPDTNVPQCADDKKRFAADQIVTKTVHAAPPRMRRRRRRQRRLSL